MVTLLLSLFCLQDPLTLEDIQQGTFGYRLPLAVAYEVNTENRSRLLKQLDKVITDSIPVIVAKEGLSPEGAGEGTCAQVTYAFDDTSIESG